MISVKKFAWDSARSYLHYLLHFAVIKFWRSHKLCIMLKFWTKRRNISKTFNISLQQFQNGYHEKLNFEKARDYRIFLQNSEITNNPLSWAHGRSFIHTPASQNSAEGKGCVPKA